jgi:LAS superfamily LD-carboxypeptidase LdcB
MRRALLAVLLATGLAVPVAAQIRKNEPPPPVSFPQDHVEPPPDVPSGTGDVTRLTSSMARAVNRAIAAAAAAGVSMRVTSGWRSAEHQERLFAAAVVKYGSAERARRWVLPPAESAHVRGEAVDVGPEAAARWLELHGVRFGLCRRYANEAWHFERLAAAVGSACPALEPHP